MNRAPDKGPSPLRAVSEGAAPPTEDDAGRSTGRGWWDPDRRRHRRGLPRFCPGCGHRLSPEEGISVEFWEGDARLYHTWCKACDWTGDIVHTDVMWGHEPAE